MILAYLQFLAYLLFLMLSVGAGVLAMQESIVLGGFHVVSSIVAVFLGPRRGLFLLNISTPSLLASYSILVALHPLLAVSLPWWLWKGSFHLAEILCVLLFGAVQVFLHMEPFRDLDDKLRGRGLGEALRLVLGLSLLKPALLRTSYLYGGPLPFIFVALSVARLRTRPKYFKVVFRVLLCKLLFLELAVANYSYYNFLATPLISPSKWMPSGEDLEHVFGWGPDLFAENSPTWIGSRAALLVVLATLASTSLRVDSNEDPSPETRELPGSPLVLGEMEQNRSPFLQTNEVRPELGSLRCFFQKTLSRIVFFTWLLCILVGSVVFPLTFLVVFPFILILGCRPSIVVAGASLSFLACCAAGVDFPGTPEVPMSVPLELLDKLCVIPLIPMLSISISTRLDEPLPRPERGGFLVQLASLTCWLALFSLTLSIALNKEGLGPLEVLPSVLTIVAGSAFLVNVRGASRFLIILSSLLLWGVLFLWVGFHEELCLNYAWELLFPSLLLTFILDLLGQGTGGGGVGLFAGCCSFTLWVLSPGLTSSAFCLASFSLQIFLFITCDLGLAGSYCCFATFASILFVVTGPILHTFLTENPTDRILLGSSFVLLRFSFPRSSVELVSGFQAIARRSPLVQTLTSWDWWRPLLPVSAFSLSLILSSFMDRKRLLDFIVATTAVFSVWLPEFLLKDAKVASSSFGCLGLLLGLASFGSNQQSLVGYWLLLGCLVLKGVGASQGGEGLLEVEGRGTPMSPRVARSIFVLVSMGGFPTPTFFSLLLFSGSLLAPLNIRFLSALLSLALMVMLSSSFSDYPLPFSGAVEEYFCLHKVDPLTLILCFLALAVVNLFPRVKIPSSMSIIGERPLAFLMAWLSFALSLSSPLAEPCSVVALTLLAAHSVHLIRGKFALQSGKFILQSYLFLLMLLQVPGMEKIVAKVPFRSPAYSVSWSERVISTLNLNALNWLSSLPVESWVDPMRAQRAFDIWMGRLKASIQQDVKNHKNNSETLLARLKRVIDEIACKAPLSMSQKQMRESLSFRLQSKASTDKGGSMEVEGGESSLGGGDERVSRLARLQSFDVDSYVHASRLESLALATGETLADVRRTMLRFLEARKGKIEEADKGESEDSERSEFNYLVEAIDDEEIIKFFTIENLMNSGELSKREGQRLQEQLVQADGEEAPRIPPRGTLARQFSVSVWKNVRANITVDLDRDALEDAETSISGACHGFLRKLVDVYVFGHPTRSLGWTSLFYQVLLSKSLLLCIGASFLLFVRSNTLLSSLPSIILIISLGSFPHPSFTLFEGLSWYMLGFGLLRLLFFSIPPLQGALVAFPQVGIFDGESPKILYDFLLLFGLASHRLYLALAGRNRKVNEHFQDLPTLDLYVPKLLLSLASFFLMLADWDDISNPGALGFTQFGASISGSHFSARHVLSVLGFLGVITLDRCIYTATSSQAWTRGSLRLAALLLLLFQLVILHWAFIFEFGSNQGLPPVAGFLYLVLSSYLAMCSVQLKFDLRPSRPGLWWASHAPTTTFQYYVYRVYRAMPFLDEMRQICDWTATRCTCLSLFMWCKVEDAQQNLYLTLHDFIARHRRLPMSSKERGCMGGGSLAALVALICSPLLFFSELNVLRVPNPVVGGELRVSLSLLDGRNILKLPPAYASSRVNLSPHNTSMSDRPFSEEFNDVDFENVYFPSSSDSVWLISPPLVEEAQYFLRKGGGLRVEASWTFSKKLGGTASVANEVDVQLSEEERRKLIDALQGQFFDRRGVGQEGGDIGRANQNTTSIELKIPSLIPYFISLGSTLTRMGDRFENGTLRLEKVHGSPSWWELQGGAELLVASERAVPSTTSGSSSKGSTFTIIGLYLYVVLTVGKFLRLSVEGASKRMLYEELPHPQLLLDLCSGIGIARMRGNLEQENYLYYQLVQIYSRPEVLLAIGGRHLGQPRRD